MRTFALIWFGQLVSLVGSGLTGFALGVWVYQRTGSVTQFTLIALCATLPRVVVSPLAGALVDRWDRRRAMILSDAGAGLSTLAVALLLWGGRLEPWHIYLASAVSSLFSAFQWPAYTAATTLLVPSEHLARASGMVQLAQAISQILSPVLAAFMMMAIQVHGVILLDFATFVFAVLTLLAVRVPKPQATAGSEAQQGSLGREIVYGWTYITARRGLFGLLIFFASSNFLFALAAVLLTPLLLVFSTPTVAGSVLSIAGVGTLVGGVALGVWGGPKRRIYGVLGFELLLGLFVLIVGLQPSVPLITAAAFLAFSCVPLIFGCSQAIWQSKVAPDVQGRVFATRRMMAEATWPLAQLVAGPLTDRVFEPLLAADGALAGTVGRVIGVGPGRGIGLTFVVAGMLAMLVTAVAYLYPRLRLVEDELPDVVTDEAATETESPEKSPDHQPPLPHVPEKKMPGKTKRRRRWPAIAGIVLLVLVAILAGAGVWFVRRPWPQTNGTTPIPSLQSPVQVVRDRWGVPHIYAQNEHDLFFAQGYVHAQDRLWQMDFSRRICSGNLSAVLGDGILDVDRFMRTIGLRRAAEKDWEALDDDTRAILEAYAEGVNAYIKANRRRLPLEFTLLGIQPAPWTPIDSLSWGKLTSLQLGGNYNVELLRARVVAALDKTAAQELLLPHGDGVALFVPPEARGYDWLTSARFEGLDAVAALLGNPNYEWGSNNWAVHGSRTATGMPMLANDTHLSLGMPSLWYENGLHGGRFDVAGVTFPGVPMVIIGHNQRVAWGVSNMGPDVQDLYIEKLNDPTNPSQYEFLGEWLDLQVVEDVIQVRNRAPVTLKVYITRHGPILNDVIGELDSAEPLALQWTALDSSSLFQAIRLVNLATDWNEFRRALSYWDVASQNFVYADVDGHIGYQATGRIPIRAAGHQGLLPVPGWTGEYEWQGSVPFDELPSLLDPSTGFVATANNKVVPDDYAYLLSYEWSSGYRAQRIIDLLAANDRVTVQDMQHIQAQTYSPPASALRPYLLAVEPQDDVQAQALAQVEAWDLCYETDRAGASVYQVWYWFLARNTLQDELGDELLDEYLDSSRMHMPTMIALMAQPESTWFDDVSTAQTETRDDIVRRSLADAVEWLSERYGKAPERWKWGRMHTMTFVHQPFGQSGIGLLEYIFNSKTIPARGDAFTVDAAAFSFQDPFVVQHGVSQRMIVDLSELDNSLAVHTTGQSGHVFHPHREDFVSMWQNVEYHPMHFAREAVKANSEAVLTLVPQQ
jgi:penicillin amidase